jgi:hypothetical protein
MFFCSDADNSFLTSEDNFSPGGTLPSKGYSHEILVPFFIYLDRYEVPNSARSGLFFILKRSSYLNFLKSWDCQYIGFGAADPGIVTVRRIFREF